jgi:hypothetical protein
MFIMPSVEFILIPPGKIPKNVEIVGGKIKAISLALPILNQKDGFLLIKFAEHELKLIDKAKSIPNARRTKFIHDWLMKNQDIALNEYQRTKKKSFRFPVYQPQEIPVRLDLYGSGTRDDPYVATVLPPPSVQLKGLGQTAVKLPLIVDLDPFGEFHFKITLKLGQLSDDNISVTSGNISFLLKRQITDLASAKFDTGTREFRDALNDAMLSITPSIREQVRKIKFKHPDWVKYLNGK